MLAGYEDLSMEFELILEMEKYFQLINNASCGSQWKHTKSTSTHWFGINTKNIYFTNKQHFFSGFHS